MAAKIRAATDIRMDEAAKQRTRAFLSEYTKMHPIQTPYGKSAGASQSYVINFLSSHAIPAFAMVLILVVGGGTAAAAEGALPGDILYPIKVHVNEEMRATLAVSPKAKADWAVDRAERRLEEAATLTLAGGLDEVTRAEIETNIDAHMRSAGEKRQELEDKKDSSDASEVELKIGALLVARDNILAGRRVAKEMTRKEPAARTISTMTMSAAMPSPEVQEPEADVETKEDEAATKGHRTAAKVRIEAAKRFLDRSPTRIGTTTREKINERLKAAREAFSSGDDDTSRGNKIEASSHFDAALDSATEIEAIVSISQESAGDDVAGNDSIEKEAEENEKTDPSEGGDGKIELRL